MNEISEEIKFLCRNKIKTTKELFSYKELVVNELKSQMRNRNALRRKRQKEKEPILRQKLCDEILNLTEKINYLKQEVVYCQKIEIQNQKIKANIKEIQKDEEKIKEDSRKKGDLQK